MPTLSFTILVEPKSVQHGSRATNRGGKLRFYRDNAKVAFMKRIKEEVKHLMPDKPFDGRLEIHMKYYVPRPEEGSAPWKMLPPSVKKELFHNHSAIPAWSNSSGLGDLTNIKKGVEDGLAEAGLCRNDGQFWKDSNEKYFTEIDLPSRIEVTIHYGE